MTEDNIPEGIAHKQFTPAEFAALNKTVEQRTLECLERIEGMITAHLLTLAHPQVQVPKLQPLQGQPQGKRR